MRANMSISVPTRRRSPACNSKREEPVQRIFAMLTTAAVLAAGPVAAQSSVESFYRGKTVTIDVFTGTGGGNDIVARLIAQNMGRHIPGNPGMVVKNLIGGGGIVLTNHLYNTAPKDG